MFPSFILAAISAGARAPVFLLTNLTATANATFPLDATATATFQSDGDISGVTGSHTDEYLDIQRAGIGAEYEVNYSSVTGDTGDMSGATTDAWHPLSSNVAYSVSSTGLGVRTVTGALTIRQISNPSNSVSATLTLTATVDSGA